MKNTIIEILKEERVVEFMLSDDKEMLDATEMCDRWFSLSIKKAEAQQLVNELQELVNQMKELPAIVAKTKVGTTVKVKVWRNKKEITKSILLGRLETSDDFKVSDKKTEAPKDTIIEDLKITVRKLTKEDIKTRKLPNQISGLVVTQIGNTSPLLKSIEANSIIVEAQKIKIKDAQDLEKIVKDVLKSNQKTILLAIYNNQNQRRYIGVKLD